MSRSNVHAVVPSQQGKAVVATATGQQVFETSKTGRGDKLLSWIESSEPMMLLSVMGGPGQAYLFQAVRHGHTVVRIPHYKLARIAGIARGASDEERATALLLALQEEPLAFYGLEEFDADMFLTRELTRVRVNLQQDYRIVATQQYKATLRDLGPLLDEGTEAQKVRTIFADSALEKAIKAEETRIEARIVALLRKKPIWEALTGNDTGLPRVYGFGPAIGGSVISEIGDIRRFPAPPNLKSYARLHVAEDGTFPRRKRGETASWNNYLHRAFWLWANTQLTFQKQSPWRPLYDYRKAVELNRHPEEVLERVVRKDDTIAMVPRYTLDHIDRRAKRWVTGRLACYIWELWTAINAGQDPAAWYAKSGWPGMFERAHAELDSWGWKLLDTELDRRRKVPAES